MTPGGFTAAFIATVARRLKGLSIAATSCITLTTTVTNKSIPIEFYEQTAREERWELSEHLTVEELRAHDITVAMSVIQYGKPEFYNHELGEFANAASWQELCEQQQIRIFGNAWRIPSDLSDEVKVLAREFRLFVSDQNDGEHMTHDIGTVFRSPAHQSRFENTAVPENAVLAIIFDGGPVASILNLSYENYKGYDAADEFFKQRSYWWEHYAHWWCWIYNEV